MRKQNDDMRVRVDGYTLWCLSAIAVLLAVLIIGLWGPGAPWASDATAQSRKGRDVFVDSAKQREFGEFFDQVGDHVLQGTSGVDHGSLTVTADRVEMI